MYYERYKYLIDAVNDILTQLMNILHKYKN